ncbi:hypothetical protein BS47DRAFT_1388468 [Hydnum rufescens UP504]|uniref:Uncharacterized protein n=1 Tax=Hydnum rufescens UP504 TaxID=1448309 RepID=A0A9P6BA27_9AGAM|nr:hypothetical protein BS47DRAFT_1388468 [Hydnum rufescens UP504]
MTSMPCFLALRSPMLLISAMRSVEELRAKGADGFVGMKALRCAFRRRLSLLHRFQGGDVHASSTDIFSASGHCKIAKGESTAVTRERGLAAKIRVHSRSLPDLHDGTIRLVLHDLGAHSTHLSLTASWPSGPWSTSF